MSGLNPFDAERHVELGKALRRILSAGGTDAFQARLLAALAREPERSSLDVLARWTRPRVAVAALVAALLGLWFGLAQPPDIAAERAELPAQVLVAGDLADDPVLDALFDGR